MSNTHRLVVTMVPCNPAQLSNSDTQSVRNNLQPARVTSLQDYPLVMTPAEAAHALGIGRNSIYTLLRSGQLNSIRIGKIIKIPRTALDEYLQHY